ncbi:hypothetical protein ACTQVS_09700, partial [Anaerovoracaceae bacterium HCP3S3_H6]
MKRLNTIISILIAFLMVFSGFGGFFFNDFNAVYATEGAVLRGESSEQGLATPTNLTWKDESTATAAWDEVEGANYYVVNVYVSVNGSEVGMAETGTTATEVDLQHEINTALAGNNADVVDVEFDVKAQYISDDTTIEGDVSSKSFTLTITTEGRTQLEKPQDVSISDDYVLSWSNYDFRGYAYYVGAVVEYNGRTKTDSF